MISNYVIGSWNYRHFIFSSVKGEILGRFARSKIGALWMILHPLAMALIYVLVLSEVLGAKIGGVENKAAYAIYLMAGISAWGLFSEISLRCLNLFIEYKSALKKIMFPRICLPIIVWLGASLNHLILLTVIFFIFILYGHMPTVHWLAIPLGFLLLSAFGFGVGVLTGILNVFSRDVGQFMTVIFNLWFWLTPIVYTKEILPDAIASFMEFNPIVAFVAIYQDAMLYHRWPDWSSLIPPTLLVIGILFLAMLAFRRASPELVDVL